jgi:transcriptional regulator with XRE-family HTH domain
MTRAARKIEDPASGLGELLRYWREVRGKSQFDLALDTGVSQRHISFIETGRSTPSREKLTQIAEGLEIPLRERNILMVAAGYAPIYADTALDAPEMAPIVTALKQVLRRHEPFPAMVLDRSWNVVMTNTAAPRFFGKFIDIAARPSPRNLLHLMFDPKGMRPFIADWQSVSKSLLERVHRESIGGLTDSKTAELIAALHRYSAGTGKGKPAKARVPAPILPMIPIGFILDNQILRYFSMITTVGTPQTIAAQELRIECMYPADRITKTTHLKLMRPRA